MENEADNAVNIEKTEASSSSEQKSDTNNDTSSSKNPFTTGSSTKVNFRSSLLSSSLSSSCAPTSSTSSDSKSFVLKAPKLSNPFAKLTQSEEKEKEVTESSKDQATNSKSSSDSSSSRVSFVPLGWNSSTSHNTSAPGQVSSSLSTSFVFGQNLSEKVEGAKSNDGQTEVSSTTHSNHTNNNSDEVKANGTTSEMLFSSAVKHDSAEVKTSESSKSLSEAAREYEEARSVKRKFEPVQLITGEEHEHNVLQMNCKLFAYDKVVSGWQERGRGLLRLNESPPVNSRLIIRAHGSLRVLINTKVFSGMVVERASPKSLRITAMDNSETVKVFLISASQTEIDDLQRHLEMRVNKMKANQNNENKKLKSEDSS